MPSSQTRTHPLRRISTGSLSSLARSQDRSSNSASGLDFLTPALVDLSDEAAMLASNLQNMSRLHDALGVFNESFAGYLYALRMNAFCVEWPEAPDDRSFARADSLASQNSVSSTAQNPFSQIPVSTRAAPQAAAVSSSVTSNAPNAFDTTYATIYSNADESLAHAGPRPTTSASSRGSGSRGRGSVRGSVRGGSVSARGRAVSGSAASAKSGVEGAADKRKREAAIAAIIETLPLEYRGTDVTARNCMEKVLTQLMTHPEGRKLPDMVAPPLAPQAKVNKCLIALVQKKLVTKNSIGVRP